MNNDGGQLTKDDMDEQEQVPNQEKQLEDLLSVENEQDGQEKLKSTKDKQEDHWLVQSSENQAASLIQMQYADDHQEAITEVPRTDDQTKSREHIYVQGMNIDQQKREYDQHNENSQIHDQSIKHHCESQKNIKSDENQREEWEHSKSTENRQDVQNDKERNVLSLRHNLETLKIEEKNPPLCKGDNSQLISVFASGNDERIEYLMTQRHATLNRYDLDILFEKAVTSNSLSIVNRLLFHQVDISQCLENCDGVLNRSEGLKLRQYINLLTDKYRKLNFTKLVQEDNIDFLHKFVENGPDVNVKDNLGYTCLHRVLLDREERLDVVKYLVEHGADINSVDPKGSPCLHLAATRLHFKVCEYFIAKGADVNSRNSRQKTLLHLVSRKSRFYDTTSVARLLVRAGADVNVVDDENLTPIETAAKEYNQRAVDYFSALEQVTVSSKISAFEIIGSLFNSKDTAIKYWTKALVLKAGEDDDVAAVSDGHILPGVQCLTSVESVKEMAQEEESRLFHSVYLLDKVLGRQHMLTLKKLKTLARSYLKTDSGEKTGSVVIKHALCKILQHRRSSSIFKHSGMVDALYDTLCCWCYYFKDKANVSFKDINEIFCLLVEQLDIFGKNRQRVKSQINEIPSSSLDLVYEIYSIIFALEKTPSEMSEFLKINETYLKIDQRFCHVFGRSIMHTTVQNHIHYFFQADINQKYELTRFLIASGVSINILDMRNNTPLHLVLKESPNSERTKIAKFLIENGAHVDYRNDAGETPLSLLANYDIEFHDVKYRSLQCLCACVIKLFRLPYETEVPIHLKAFIGRH